LCRCTLLDAYDGSEGSKKALAAAIAIAKRFRADLHSISVKERGSQYPETVGEVMEEKEETDKFFAGVTEEALDWAQSEGVDLQCEVRSGHEVEAIIEFARQEHFHLLVVGFMGHSRIFGRIWGGTSQNLTKTAPCSVLVVK
jgi:nucleotide-binding universal stress UspA family protein